MEMKLKKLIFIMILIDYSIYTNILQTIYTYNIERLLILGNLGNHRSY